MPMETIRAEGFDIEVSWGRGRDIQVATVIRPPTEPYTIEQGLNGPETVETPASIGTLIQSWSPEEMFTTRGLYATIDDRETVNALIRVLKRARDHAFGKDA